MFVLGPGQFTGSVMSSVNLAGVVINTTHHAADEWALGLHYHERPHLCLVLHGADIETRRGEECPRQAGAISFYRAGEPHASTRRVGTARHANIEISDAFLRQYDVTEDTIDRAMLRPDAPFLALRIHREARRGDDLSPVAIESLLLALVASAEPAPAPRSPHWTRVLAAMLGDHWNQPLSLQQLSREAGVHPVTISKHFRRHFSCTLGQYVRRLRITRSLPLVTNPDIPLSDVAWQCGFADQSHFTRTFRSLTGFSPGAYRRL